MRSVVDEEGEAPGACDEVREEGDDRVDMGVRVAIQYSCFRWQRQKGWRELMLC